MRAVMLLTGLLLMVPAVAVAHPFQDQGNASQDHVCSAYRGESATFSAGAHSLSTRDLTLTLTGEEYHMRLYLVTEDGEPAATSGLFLETNNLNGLQDTLICKDKADARSSTTDCNARNPDPEVCVDHGDEQLL